MPNFDRGVSGFVKMTCTVTVNFPIDHNGNADVSCSQCPYYSRSTRLCRLNGEITHYPEKYIGYYCPLKTEEVEDSDKIQNADR